MKNLTPTTAKTSVLRAGDRGTADHGWLKARFTFSFAGYFNPDRMGFRSLRVMNNDTIEPGGGFPTHPHSDMEIFTYVVEGELAHRDSMGNGSTIKAGDLQYMSAGSGVQHSEFNPSKENRTHLYQIWLHPKQPGGEPRYAEKPLGAGAGEDALTLLFSEDGRDGSTPIRQDAQIFFGKARPGSVLDGDDRPRHDRLHAGHPQRRRRRRLAPRCDPHRHAAHRPACVDGHQRRFLITTTRSGGSIERRRRRHAPGCGAVVALGAGRHRDPVQFTRRKQRRNTIDQSCQQPDVSLKLPSTRRALPDDRTT